MAYYSKDKNGNPRSGKSVDDLLDKIEESGIANGTITIGGESITPITEHQDVSGKVDRSELAEVAFTGDYDDLKDKPVIPSLDGYATEQWVGQQGFITSQAIEGKEDKSNKVTSWQSTPDNTHYPSEKLVKDSIDGVKVFVAEYGVTTRAEITTAYNNGRSLFVQYGNALIPLNNYEENGGCFFAAPDYLGLLRHCYINSNSVWATGLKQLENASGNKKQTITGNESSNSYYPTTKAVADYVSGIVGDINTILDQINGEEI